MIEIRSYLRVRGGEFIPVENEGNSPPDPYYVEGAMELVVNGIHIIDLKMWDYIDQLWSYVSRMTLDLSQNGKASTYFPDQPIELTFVRQKGGRILVSLSSSSTSRATSIDEREFVSALQCHGKKFFDKMKILLPENIGSYENSLDFLRRSRYQT